MSLLKYSLILVVGMMFGQMVYATHDKCLTDCEKSSCSTLKRGSVQWNSCQNNCQTAQCSQS